MTKYGWFVDGILLIVLAFLTLYFVRCALSVIHIDAIKALSLLLQEARQLVELRFTVGAINFLGVIATFVFGVAVIIFSKFDKLIVLIGGIVGENKARAFASSNLLLIVFGFVVAFTVFSLICVVYDDQRRK